MFGDLFLCVVMLLETPMKRTSRFRPHVWGSFFMFGDAFCIFFCHACFRPHVWGSFFMKVGFMGNIERSMFSSPCLGIFFYAVDERFPTKAGNVVFVPMFGDLFLWKQSGFLWLHKGIHVFVPMFGDLFLIVLNSQIYCMKGLCFRPHVWGSFFMKIYRRFGK